jgi:hypothetical protein
MLNSISFLKKNIRRNPEEIKSLCVNHGLLIFAIKTSSLMKRQKGEFMSKWHNIREDEIIFKTPNCREGKYLVYDKDTFDYLVNNNDWVFNNDAIEEQEWILDNMDKILESNDEKEIFIPTARTATKIDNYYAKN